MAREQVQLDEEWSEARVETVVRDKKRGEFGQDAEETMQVVSQQREAQKIR